MSMENNLEAWRPRLPVDTAAFRDAMARMGAAVNIVTSDGQGGRVGFTASAVCSVTDNPPTVLVCLNRASSAYEAVTKNQVLCVNTLAGSHEGLSRLFGGKTPTMERFGAAAWSTLTTGAPLLDGALVAFDCRIVHTVAHGTHDVLFCEVVEVMTGSEPQKGLVYFSRQYHHLGVSPN